MSELSVDGRLRRDEEVRQLVEAFRWIGLVEEADEMERTGVIEGEDLEES